jgi:NAD-dependent SIR2 family protein deacetylase
MSTDGFDAYVDGNAAAGALHEVFAVDLTAATAQCEGCGQMGPLARARLYTNAPGLVARCDGCDSVLLRVVSAPGRTWLDMRGLRSLEVRTDDD